MLNLGNVKMNLLYLMFIFAYYYFTILNFLINFLEIFIILIIIIF